MNHKFITKSPEETQKIGKEFAKEIIYGGIVALYGDLGYGKTTFVQGVAKGLGIERRIISPTFVVIRSYELKSQNSIVKSISQISNFFYHIDLYRMQSVQELESLGLQEILQEPNTIILIEWPEKLGELLPEKRINVSIEDLRENRRKIRIENF